MSFVPRIKPVMCSHAWRAFHFQFAGRSPFPVTPAIAAPLILCSGAAPFLIPAKDRLMQQNTSKGAGVSGAPNRPTWAADAVETRHIDSLKADDRNARKHSASQIEQIRKLMNEYGWTNPVLIRANGKIIAGHGRIMAAREEVAAGNHSFAQVPCLVAPPHWNEAQIRAYVIADNRIAEKSEWDLDLLGSELASLGEMGFDLGLTGFDDFDIGGLGDISEGLPSGGASRVQSGALAERFLVPPFSVLNAREGGWQDRKREWLALGIRSELGRGEQLIPNSGGMGSKAAYDQNASEGRAPGGRARPATNWSKSKKRGAGNGAAL